MMSFRILVIAAVSLSLQACAVEPPLASASSESVTVSTDYHLGAGDKFRLNVFNEPTLSGSEFTVTEGGTVSLPLIGSVKVGGMTMPEAEAAITARYAAGFLNNPKVNVEVTLFRPYYILGEVNKPDEYAYVNKLTLLGAIAKAGGFTYRAKRDLVYVRHADSTREVPVTVAADTAILPGDTVRVIERFF